MDCTVTSMTPPVLLLLPSLKWGFSNSSHTASSCQCQTWKDTWDEACGDFCRSQLEDLPFGIVCTRPHLGAGSGYLLDDIYDSLSSHEHDIPHTVHQVADWDHHGLRNSGHPGTVRMGLVLDLDQVDKLSSQRGFSDTWGQELRFLHPHQIH